MDSNGNKRNAGNDEIVASISPLFVGGHQQQFYCNVEYMIDGLYIVICPSVSHAGSYLLHVGLSTSSGVDPIKSSPFPLTIVPGKAAPEMTTIVGMDLYVDSIKLTGKAGRYEAFSIRSRDIFNNALEIGGDRFIARVRGDTRIESFEKRIEVVDQG